MSYADDNLPIGMEDAAFEAYLDSYRFELCWKTNVGESIPITEMSTRHIKNCIDKINRSIKLGRPWRTSYLTALKAEYDSRMFLVEMRNMSDEQFNKIVHKNGRSSSK